VEEEMGVHVARMGRRGIRIGYWWESQKDIVKIDLRDIDWDDMDWIDMAQDGDQWRPLVNTIMKIRVP
jgi:hypothetical protein